MNYYLGAVWSMKISKLLTVIGSELGALYAFWVFRLVDFLGYGSVANRLRGVILKIAGFKIGAGCIIRPGVYIHCLNAPVQIGKSVSINRNVYFDAPSPVTIGNFVNVGHGTKFVNSSHQLISNFETLRPNVNLPPIVIEDYAWLGCNVLILGGVTVGTGSVVGAGSVVTKSIPPHSFAVGIPAKVIRSLEPPAKEV
jgi:acetyltransferase-like isoleucine patch superfamily enzyme